MNRLAVVLGVLLFTLMSTPAVADEGGRIAFCAVTTPVRIFARLLGAPKSQYCTPWAKGSDVAKKEAPAPAVQASDDKGFQDEKAAEPAVRTAQASK